MNMALQRWNALDESEAAIELLPCNGSRAWAAAMARHRPFAAGAALFAAADHLWAALSDTDRDEAYNSHPRLGERTAVTAEAQSLAWSAGEQSALTQDATLVEALRQANLAYEQQFGRIFLLCATGLRTAEVLEALQRRLQNDAATEAREAAEQQRRITQLRLRKWLGLSPASPDAV